MQSFHCPTCHAGRCLLPQLAAVSSWSWHVVACRESVLVWTSVMQLSQESWPLQRAPCNVQDHMRPRQVAGLPSMGLSSRLSSVTDPAAVSPEGSTSGNPTCSATFTHWKPLLEHLRSSHAQAPEDLIRYLHYCAPVSIEAYTSTSVRETAISLLTNSKPA